MSYQKLIKLASIFGRKYADLSGFDDPSSKEINQYQIFQDEAGVRARKILDKLKDVLEPEIRNLFPEEMQNYLLFRIEDAKNPSERVLYFTIDSINWDVVLNDYANGKYAKNEFMDQLVEHSGSRSGYDKFIADYFETSVKGTIQNVLNGFKGEKSEIYSEKRMEQEDWSFMLTPTLRANVTLQVFPRTPSVRITCYVIGRYRGDYTK
jgi:hypothetical protein